MYIQRDKGAGKWDVVSVVYVSSSGDLIDVSPQSVMSVKFTYVVTVVSFSGTKENRISAQPTSDGVCTGQKRKLRWLWRANYHDSLSVFSTLFVLLDVLEPPVQTASRPDHPLLTYGPSNTPSPRKGVQIEVFF
jgi:hypothetical protein